MNIKIVTDVHGVGLGNQVWFIPAILELKKKHYIYTDSMFYKAWDIASFGFLKPDLIMVPMWPDWRGMIQLKREYWGIQIQGFQYRILGKSVGWGYAYSRPVDLKISEFKQIDHLLQINTKFKLKPKYKVVPDTVVFGTSDKSKCYYPYWDELEGILLKKGYLTIRLGEKGETKANYTILRYILEKAEYFIGVDSGLMHMADILNKKGVCIWGKTANKNKPLNLKIIYGLNTKPEEVISNLFT